MNPKEKLAALLKSMQAIVAGAKASGRDLSDAEIEDLEAKNAEAEELRGKIARSEKSAALMASIGGMKSDDEGEPTPQAGQRAKSLGEHFVKHLGNRSLKNPGTIAVPEFKAATDTQAVGGHEGAYGPLITDVDRNFILPKRERLVVEDLLGSGNVSGTAITYPVFGPLEGGTDFVGEGRQKPQMHVGDPTWRTDALGEVAGWFKMTDDMAEDLDYVVSEINSTALYDLAQKTEQALLSGSGTGVNLLGIRNREGVQTHVQGIDTVADAIFKGIRKVQTATGFTADALVINPLDYENLRLGKDGNGQYYGGGYFQGQYGNGGFIEVPPVWGLRTVVSLAAPQGEPLVGAYRPAAKVFRKGGVRVESTNSHEDDFTNDKITVRVKARLGLQVKYPSAFVKIQLKDTTPVEDED
ncbi:phage major capsid protein [Microbacterium caowuchunii]|uniref:Phage major capsid protein n=1 Tax=Microbacterium caowuchunii TaxID=2614638 RepID=A0A5N0TFB0_9MICO|nr:phage major capsid protein [Microbacterium caowuchunii]KAA9133755.1 phage major capsid protein [Microbacterium caowuchunii]